MHLVTDPLISGYTVATQKSFDLFLGSFVNDFLVGSYRFGYFPDITFVYIYL